MKCKIIILRNDISGGTATLSIRIGESLVHQGHEVIYIHQELNDTNNVNTMKEKGIVVLRWKLEDIVENLTRVYNNSQFIFLTYSLNEFLFVERLKGKLEINKNILYVVHHFDLIRGSNQNVIIRKIIRTFYKTLINSIIDSNSIIFMDKQTEKESENYYGFKINVEKLVIFNLPIQVQNINFKIIEEKLSLDAFNLLTITRASFPFKGYVIGLIEDFEKLCAAYNDITLTIITFGKDEHKITEKIEKLPVSIQNKITLVGRTPYDELKKYFNKSHLYLGMGTTLLDAVNNGVPALAVQHYTYNNYSSGFFHTQPNLLVGIPEINISSCIYIEEVKQMNKVEYINLCKKEHDKLLENYNIYLLIDFLKQENVQNNKKILTDMQLFIHKIIIKVSAILKKNHEFKIGDNGI